MEILVVVVVSAVNFCYLSTKFIIGHEGYILHNLVTQPCTYRLSISLSWSNRGTEGHDMGHMLVGRFRYYYYFCSTSDGTAQPRLAV